MLINSPISFGELVDKMTILGIKSERMNDISKLRNIEYEYKQLRDLFEKNYSVLPYSLQTEMKMLLSELRRVNLNLWEIEDNIRECEKNKMFDEKFINLARSVYITNDERAELKKRINILTNSSIIEEKSYKEYK